MQASRFVAAAFAAAGLIGSGSAQGQATNRADITHQGIPDAFNSGQVGGVYGYAWGSQTCNIGSDPLLWINGGTPALAMNAYRLHNGVLTQIGVGNCKHACCVGNGTGCGTCQAGPAGTLRPGCRDTYGAGFNAGQSRLGPRSGINPYDGTFTTITGTAASAIDRRVQVKGRDMDASNFPGAVFIAEGVYVCAEEDPAAQLNNASYRLMTVATAGATPTYNWTVNAAHPTATGIPAIQAWRDHGLGLNQPDTTVQVVHADVPDEGHFVAAGKVRDLSGNGTGPWRYDYAVFNLNSHRSGGSLEINVPATAIVTDLGFSSPEYHSGEIYSNTPWTAAKQGGKVRFASPQDFATNANTNALRWGTMYNFWFTANVAPAAAMGSVELGLFRPGTPTSILIAGLPVPTVPPACQADFNGVNGVTVEDVFAFLAAYFGNAPAADYNGQAGISVQDLFDFLEDYFAGCP